MNKKDNVITESLFRLASIELFDGVFSNGLFTVDKKNGKISMNPGVYTLRDSIAFGILEDTKVENIECRPLTDGEGSAARDESAAAHHDTA